MGKVVRLQSRATAEGNGDNAQTIGFKEGVFQVTGTFTGTITFEAIVSPGDTWVAIRCKNLTSAAVAITATAAGLYRAEDGVGGLKAVRARISAYTTGTIDVNIGLT